MTASPQCAETRSGRPGRGFTLIELLVVVAIIAMLISILLPSLSRAKEQARQVYCSNNLRSIWTAVLTYALESRERLPFMEDCNIANDVMGTGPDANPFDSRFPSSVGNVMYRYVGDKSWVCPAAIAGFPASAGDTGWKMTYVFSAAGGVGDGIPYDLAPNRNTGSTFDPAMSNYVHFDGRPLKMLDGRRYTSSGPNENDKGFWRVRREIVADAIVNESFPMAGGFLYPHRGQLDDRNDLENAEADFYKNTNSAGARTGRMELHADADRVKILYTRSWETHLSGY